MAIRAATALMRCVAWFCWTLVWAECHGQGAVDEFGQDGDAFGDLGEVVGDVAE
ncbi:hypothetical protein GCM10011579_067710 [Streptomyces albiflavescens]|uniref:Uncharacterized protein n=1 Tax=Streptomyces albiflavescens TaxID=1623582 RepID=A0A917Y9U7_9ACTN|nr:hypothetical protein [Streptomyces albiflavescens]GGN81307.1 hypothetical protein GCM10011579_067710 [Streptomyces albiflavescens]